MEHFLSIEDVSLATVQKLLISATEMKDLVTTNGGDERLKNKILATIFYEPSTRTSCSFQAAILRLGGSFMHVNAVESSAKKGESLEDTIQTVSSYCDAIVLRHPEKGSTQTAAKVATKPILNAGDGIGEHPTQAMLDLFTIKLELGCIGGANADNKMVITMLGDLKHGRPVHSLAILLSMFPNITLIYISPDGLDMPNYIIEKLDNKNIEQIRDMTLNQAIEISDVIYTTRVQKERFASIDEYEKVLGSYCVDKKLMEKVLLVYYTSIIKI